MKKILIGGSPCTHWSIAQKNNRETTAEGIGWELFKNYLIAKEKFKADFFLYENNKSAAQAIKDQIAKELGVGVDPMARFTYINSALVSAQNRQRFYVTNFGDIEQPVDRGVLLRDILESGMCWRQKAYALKAQYYKSAIANFINGGGHFPQTGVAEPVAVDLQVKGRKANQDGEYERMWEARTDGKSSCLTSVDSRRMVAEPVRIGLYPNNAKNQAHDSKQYRIYSVEGKATTLCGNGGGMGAKTGLYAIPVSFDGDTPLTAISCADGKTYPVYEVRGGMITIKGKEYPVKLLDGYYIIRKLTVTECCRLQTLPDDYCKAVSNSQAYKGLGNGWTAEIIIHLLNHALKDIPRDEEIVALSMYDGIGTGRYCLDKMGFTNVKYHAYEIDKYAMGVANDNYPDIIQHGDAFAVREDDWTPPEFVKTFYEANK